MPNAILSVYDKTGLDVLAHGLVKLGWKLFASGGTTRSIQALGLPVMELADYTSSPEILGGRVKTLHPRVFGGLLAQNTPVDLGELSNIAAEPFDLAVVNLYPFLETSRKPDVSLAEAIEMIDIGGVALIRAAAKNYARVSVIVSPEDYARLLNWLEEEGMISYRLRQEFALKAFEVTAAYDTAIANFFQTKFGLNGDIQSSIPLFKSEELRYGENPHQKAELLSYRPGEGPLGGRLIHGKPLSYNNLLDLDAAWRTVTMFTRPTVVITKHVSPCGVASGDTLAQAFPRAFASDPVSAFGSVIAVNLPLDEATVQQLGDLFVECIAAPDFTEGCLEMLASRKNLRLLKIPVLDISPPFEFRSICHGVLKQDLDFGDPDFTNQWKVVTIRQPTETEWIDLKFAWKVVQQVKSNAIVLAKSEATIGIGGGQPNRVDSVKIAGRRAGHKANGAVMASDAFFPFPDSVLEAISLGITAIIHPGGSIRDQDSIQAADDAGLSMILTGTRHFKH